MGESVLVGVRLEARVLGRNIHETQFDQTTGGRRRVARELQDAKGLRLHAAIAEPGRRQHARLNCLRQIERGCSVIDVELGFGSLRGMIVTVRADRNEDRCSGAFRHRCTVRTTENDVGRPGHFHIVAVGLESGSGPLCAVQRDVLFEQDCRPLPIVQTGAADRSRPSVPRI